MIMRNLFDRIRRDTWQKVGLDIFVNVNVIFLHDVWLSKYLTITTRVDRSTYCSGEMSCLYN